MLQRVIALSLEEARIASRPRMAIPRGPGATPFGTPGEYDEESTLAAAIAASLESSSSPEASNSSVEPSPRCSGELIREEGAGSGQLGRDPSSDQPRHRLAMAGRVDAVNIAPHQSKDRLSRQVNAPQSMAREHSSNEAAAAHAATDSVHSALSDALHNLERKDHEFLPGNTSGLVVQYPPGQSPTPRSEHGVDHDDDDEGGTVMVGADVTGAAGGPPPSSSPTRRELGRVEARQDVVGSIAKDGTSTNRSVPESDLKKKDEDLDQDESDLEALRAQIAKHSGYS